MNLAPGLLAGSNEELLCILRGYGVPQLRGESNSHG
jgi:hypothetical protein